MENKTPEYFKAVAQKKPRLDDPKDLAIVQKIKEQIVNTEWARNTLDKIHNLQINYLKEVISKVEDHSWVYTRTQNFLKETSVLLKTEIVEGAKFLNEIPKGSPVLLVTNHLGLDKLATIDTKKDLGIDIPGYDKMFLSPVFFGSLSPVAEELDDNLSYVSNDFPSVLGEVIRASGYIHVPPTSIQKTNKTEILLEQANDLFKKRSNTAVVNFPEGGTSGKFSEMEPYDLESFKTGVYVIASKLGICVVPVVQYFDPNKGLQLKIFESYIPVESNKAGYEKHANEDRSKMQKWLDTRKAY